MSYDIAVFDVNKAPKNKPAFLAWYEEQTAWEADLDYDEPDNAEPALHAWLLEMAETYPPMNGHLAPDAVELEGDELLENRLTDYTISQELIYAAFAWSELEPAVQLAVQLARKHSVGFFNASSQEGQILWPDGTILS